MAGAQIERGDRGFREELLSVRGPQSRPLSRQGALEPDFDSRGPDQGIRPQWGRGFGSRRRPVARIAPNSFSGACQRISSESAGTAVRTTPSDARSAACYLWWEKMANLRAGMTRSSVSLLNPE